MYAVTVLYAGLLWFCKNILIRNAFILKIVILIEFNVIYMQISLECITSQHDKNVYA